MNIRPITDLSVWYDDVRLALSYDPDGHDWLEVAERVKSGEFMAIELYTAAVLIIEIQSPPIGKVLNVILVAGSKMDVWLKDAVLFLRNMATDQGCKQIRIQGRPGWAKQLERRGFDYRAALLVMEV